MVTATRKSRVAGRRPRRTHEPRVPESIQFLIFEDNGGAYHWTIVAADGATLARSKDFASHEDAERAAQHVRDRAASAPFEHRAASVRPVDLTAGRSATSNAADAKRWLDEGASVRAAAPAPRAAAPATRR